MANKKIIGIDPGTNIFGYAVIEVNKKLKQKYIIHSVGVVHLSKFENHYLKLEKIFEKINHLIEAFGGDEMAIEAPFYGKNAQSMLKLGRAQGAAILAATTNKLPVTEYSPKKIKQSITGSGNASKEQLAAMLKNMLKLETLPTYFDATDALGVAICHDIQNSSPLAGLKGKHKNWKSFLQANKDRIK